MKLLLFGLLWSFTLAQLRQQPRQLGQEMLMNFQAAKTEFITKLRADYGSDVYPEVFEDTRATLGFDEPRSSTIGRQAFGQGEKAGDSWERVKRKFMIKVLRFQMSGKTSPFVWATAGDQVAAGRGNFFDQQYTVVLEKSVKKVMETVGIDFKTRPYGIGSLRSAPEIAACAKAIFGEDVDMIAWDFTSSDGNQVWRLEYFAHRIARMQNRPSLLVLQSDDARKPLVDHLTGLGMAILGMDTNYVMNHMMRMPDSSSGPPSGSELVKYFRCGSHIESGSPCSEYKFLQNGICDNRGHQTSWHPGWKWHAFQANLYALFLIEVLEDAMATLAKRAGEDKIVILKKLEEQEANEYTSFETKNDFLHGDVWGEAFKSTGLSAHQLADGQTYCHTARLPAQARYMGYVTDVPFEEDLNDFDRGISLKDGVGFQTNQMLLTYDDEAHSETCKERLQIDYKDFFLATGAYDGYQEMIVPNDSEMGAFGTLNKEGDYDDPLGILLVCGAGCHHDCPKETLDMEAISNGLAAIKVNDDLVDHIVPYQDCYLLANKSGDLRWTANENHQYTIAIDVKTPEKYMRIGSVIVW